MCARIQDRRLRPLCLAAATLTLSQTIFAQWTPTLPSHTAAAQQPAPAGTSGYNLQLHVPLVLEDVVVLDHEGQPVHGLKASDLTVTENGSEVTLRSFEEHSTAGPAPIPARPNLEPDGFTNLTPTPANHTLNVLLFDALNTSLTDQSSMHDQLLEYLKALPPGIPMAVFGLSDRLYLLQGFSTDPKTLVAAIDASQKMLHASPRLDNPVSDEPAQKLSDQVLQGLNLGDPDVARMLANVQQFEREKDIAQTAQRVQYTLQALNQLGRYLEGLPGRKNVIWFSGSFPINFLPDSTLPEPFMAVADFQDDVRKTTDLLARGRVALYPIDGRGLQNIDAFSAAQSDQAMARMLVSGWTPPRQGPGAYLGAVSTNPADRPGGYGDTIRKFFQTTTAEHATMTFMAEATGGKAYFNTNGLKEAAEKALNDGGDYYTFTYTPPDEKFDGSIRRIQVKVDRPGAHLSYRQDYFADDPDAARTGKKVLPQSAMQQAMMFGTPEATQIPLAVRAIPEDGMATQTSQGTKPNTKLMKAPYRRYDLVCLVDVRSVEFSVSSDGVRHARLEVAAVVYTDDGELADTGGNHINLDLAPERYAEIVSRGLRIGQTIEAPAKGDYFLRMGVDDLVGDRIGTVEIPTASLKSEKGLRANGNKVIQQSPGK